MSEKENSALCSLPRTETESIPPVVQSDSAPRLVSLDALRGFDMFWIVGGEEIVHALYKMSDADVIRLAEEEGLAFYDLIFPLFVFIVGVSLVFSLGKTIAQEGRGAAVRRLARRSVLLFILGVITYGGMATPFAQIRLLGVLQRIALCYLFAGLTYCFMSLRAQIVLCAVLLATYWALMTWVPVPGEGAGSFVEGKNLANFLDSEYLPLRKWDGDHDPEGLLSTLPAIATCLLGVFAGVFLKSVSFTNWQKVFGLIVAGLVLAGLGWLWNNEFPVIKKLWTSSYVLVAGGYSCLLLAAFYMVIDVWKWQMWARPFVWIGMNAITIYMLFHLVNFTQLAERLVGGEFNRIVLSPYGPLAIALVVVSMSVGICYFLYRRKIFLRL